ncbi:Octanoyltransferase [compost metagenome]
MNVKAGIEAEGFRGIIPCGIQQFGITSLEDATGRSFTVEQAARDIVPYFNEVFGYNGRMGN